MLLHKADVDYDWNPLTFEEFGALKLSGKFPTGQVPIFKDENGR